MGRLTLNVLLSFAQFSSPSCMASTAATIT
jgi:hypothetical protein